MIAANVRGIMQKQSVQQFVKFCIVGASSAVIDVGVFTLLHLHYEWYWVYARFISVLLSVINGFIWNSIWTFRGLGADKYHLMFMKFLGINIVGLALNLGIMKLVFLLTEHPSTTHPDKLHTYAALAIAIVLVSIWNFAANKFWTFRASAL